MTMNDLMVRSFSQVVEKLVAHRAILDAADANAARFAERVKKDQQKLRSISGRT